MFQLTDQPISASAETSHLRNASAGALATFEGWVRNHNEGKDVDRLEYEAYASMAIKEGERIVAEACEKFDLLDAHCVHRTGDLGIGEIAVWVGVSSVHRGPAFDACEYIIDQTKSRVPIWKKEHYTDGAAEWVACHECAQHAGHGE
ncbi:MAG: molybdenum cofactor biosynthesis protein MoaE [Verrucomicrobia bacterium]|nr:molybdenum cofactor biosynthesis protein MoaE [Verrucomicrobiota bacterium]MDA1087737.1 molybdenum cofactor biosynthesis protein MoaE [Verrucomicrobiota bacterium]